MGRSLIAFLDACAIIYLIEGQEPFRGRTVAALKALRAENPDARLAVSRLSLMECLVHPLKKADAELERAYRSFFTTPDLTVVELTPKVVESAAILRAKAGLKSPDALQAACAVSLGEKSIVVTNDTRFAKVPGLKTVLI